MVVYSSGSELLGFFAGFPEVGAFVFVSRRRVRQRRLPGRTGILQESLDVTVAILVVEKLVRELDRLR
jgi:hypothetical protein